MGTNWLTRWFQKVRLEIAAQTCTKQNLHLYCSYFSIWALGLHHFHCVQSVNFRSYSVNIDRWNMHTKKIAQNPINTALFCLENIFYDKMDLRFFYFMWIKLVFFVKMAMKFQYCPKVCNYFLNFVIFLLSFCEDAGDGHRNKNLYIIWWVDFVIAIGKLQAQTVAKIQQ